MDYNEYGPTEWDLTDSSSVGTGGLGAVLINGVVMFDSSSASDVDPYFPAAWSGGTKTTAETVDGCIGHPDGDAMYHYHIMSPCLFNTDWQYSTDICATITACASDLASYVLTGYSNVKSLTVIGVSKDGHPLFGPYTAEGEQRSCGTLDTCNGITQTNGSYAYYATETFPYGVACYGPGTNPYPYTAECSTNLCTDSTDAASFASLSVSLVIAFSAFMML
jgi:hypothetical protein